MSIDSTQFASFIIYLIPELEKSVVAIH